MIADRTYTRSEYEVLLAQHPQRRFELINGEIVEKVPTELHGLIVHLIGGFLFIYLRANPIGYAMVEARHGLPDDNANDRIPDLSFRVKDKGAIVTQGAAPYMPDLAVEVQSPNQNDRAMADKAAYYLAHGSRMVWLIYPDRRLVEVLTPESRHLLTDAGHIDGGDVLPGLRIPVVEIFPATAEASDE